MVAGILVFSDGNVNREQAEKLLELCTVKLMPDHPPFEIFAAEDGSDIAGRLVVCPVEFKSKAAAAQRCVTYSAKDNSADIVAINLQRHTGYVSFELMSAEHMGRVFIDNSKGIDAEAVLMAAAVMYAMGAPLKNVISVINSILKN